MEKTIKIGRSNIFLAGLAIVWLMACTGQYDSKNRTANEADEMVQDSSGQSFILFDTLSHDFGTIIEGVQVVCYFDFVNSGDGPLIIQSVEATCGCTTPDWSREPLHPGEKEHLKIVFDSSGRSGKQRKIITILSNAENYVMKLTITANIKSNI